jgi:hypothetical protein
MTLTPEQEYLAHLREQARKAVARADAWEERIRPACTHPNPTTWTWEHDNGYGKQSKVEGQRCGLCGAIKHWASSSLWLTREDQVKELD